MQNNPAAVLQRRLILLENEYEDIRLERDQFRKEVRIFRSKVSTLESHVENLESYAEDLKIQNEALTRKLSKIEVKSTSIVASEH